MISALQSCLFIAMNKCPTIDLTNRPSIILTFKFLSIEDLEGIRKAILLPNDLV